MGSQYRVEMLACVDNQVDSDGLKGVLAAEGFRGATAEQASLLIAHASVAG